MTLIILCFLFNAALLVDVCSYVLFCYELNTGEGKIVIGLITLASTIFALSSISLYVILRSIYKSYRTSENLDDWFMGNSKKSLRFVYVSGLDGILVKVDQQGMVVIKPKVNDS